MSCRRCTLSWSCCPRSSAGTGSAREGHMGLPPLDTLEPPLQRPGAGHLAPRLSASWGPAGWTGFISAATKGRAGRTQYMRMGWDWPWAPWDLPTALACCDTWRIFHSLIWLEEREIYTVAVGAGRGSGGARKNHPAPAWRRHLKPRVSKNSCEAGNDTCYLESICSSQNTFYGHFLI